MKIRLFNNTSILPKHIVVQLSCKYIRYSRLFCIDGCLSSMALYLLLRLTLLRKGLPNSYLSQHLSRQTLFSFLLPCTRFPSSRNSLRTPGRAVCNQLFSSSLPASKANYEGGNFGEADVGESGFWNGYILDGCHGGDGVEEYLWLGLQNI